MTRYAIIISVEKYSRFQPTPFAHADGKSLRSVLIEKCDYTAQHCLSLQLAPENTKTADEILAEIKKTVEGAGSGDSILFYFAGHGHLAKKDEAYLILPGTEPNKYESTALALDKISEELRRPELPCFRVFDACHSGLDVRSNSDEPDSGAFVRAVTHDASGWVTLAACREDEFSYPDQDLGHGVFTYYLCEYIRNLEPDKPVLPELLKVDIVERVLERTKQRQTPTLNASISGNISLAVRRQDDPQEKPDALPTETAQKLRERIVKLQNMPDLLAEGHLEKSLEILVEACKSEFERMNELGGELSTTSPISADDIPEGMHREVVEFVRRQGFHPRHKFEREIERERLPRHYLLSDYRPRILTTHYDICQSSDLPETAALLKIQGDGRCIPDVQVLLYVIPLQLKACLLVTSFRRAWPPHEDSLELLCHSYQDLNPGGTAEEAKELAPFAVKKTMERLRQYVERRVTMLEEELRK